MRNVDIHTMTQTELALLKHEITDEIRQLREVGRDIGTSSDQESAIDARYTLVDEIDRELAHRRTHPNGD